jgi:hypothetical protein
VEQRFPRERNWGRGFTNVRSSIPHRKCDVTWSAGTCFCCESETNYPANRISPLDSGIRTPPKAVFRIRESSGESGRTISK